MCFCRRPTALIFCDSIFLFTIVPLLIELGDREHPSLLHALGVVMRQIARRRCRPR
jgi:hypothetical protein